MQAWNQGDSASVEQLAQPRSRWKLRLFTPVGEEVGGEFSDNCVKPLQSDTMGSRITAAPCLRMRTSSPSIRNCLGSRTAWERPDQNSLAVSVIHLISRLIYSCAVYHRDPRKFKHFFHRLEEVIGERRAILEVVVPVLEHGAQHHVPALSPDGDAVRIESELLRQPHRLRPPVHEDARGLAGPGPDGESVFTFRAGLDIASLPRRIRPDIYGYESSTCDSSGDRVALMPDRTSIRCHHEVSRGCSARRCRPRGARRK